MRRCLTLAALGAGHVAPNPMVGAVLIHDGNCIAEGYHQQYGEAHAELNCIRNAIDAGLEHLISQSTLYVSLEPCAHYGKTPPCADLIIRHKIPKVVIGCRDPFEEVNGRGIEKLKAAGVEVLTFILENECREINKRFFMFHKMKRPYVILKWAQTSDGKIGYEKNDRKNDSGRMLISNEYSNRLVHKWRSEEAGILVGTNTALVDDPELTVRLWKGPSPIRLVVDKELRLPSTLKLFDQQHPTIVFNMIREEEKENLRYWKIGNEDNLVKEILHALYSLKIQSVLVEGGAQVLQSFIDADCWDEARVIQNSTFLVERGVQAPVLRHAVKTMEMDLQTDHVDFFSRHPEPLS